MSNSSTLRIVCLAVVLLSSRSLAAQDTNATAEQLHKLFEDEWERSLVDDPTYASWLGDPRFNDRWQDVSPEAIDRRITHRRAILKRLDEFDVKQLGQTDRISLQLFRRKYQNVVDEYPFGWHLVPLNQRGGIQDESTLADAMSFESVQDYENWIARLTSFPVYMDQTLNLMREGVQRKIIHARVVMQRLPAQIERQIVDDPTQSLYYKPFRNMPDSITTREQQRLQQAGREAITTHVVPAYRGMLRFFNETYLPACYDKPGAWQFPNGKDFYALRCRVFTTTDMTPQEIHDTGLREVKRIRYEMLKVVQQVGFEGSFDEFLDHLRTDPKFYYDNPNDLLAAYREVCMRINPRLVRLFNRLPRIPYGVEPIPPHLAPDTTTAYYRQPSADGMRAGTYFVNLYRPEVRPKYEIEVLSVHEAMPGHHLQIALAQEIEGLPLFRRYGGYTAFIEGWALYSESLGSDLGLYKDPYSKFGQLTYEMWRAVRLVVDTGIHEFGWSRQDAIDFFTANTAKTPLDIANEVDRYISWPGQALAYKIGELKIKELRRRAESELGDKFEVREFHATILGQGAVTLDVLDGIVDDWIAGVRSR
jgi:prolyl oligopeptidase